MKFARTYSPDGNRHIYYNRDYRQTRRLINWEAICAQGIAVLYTGSFLAGYMKYIGIDDAFSAILMQVPLLASVAQLFAPLFFSRKKRRLRSICLFAAIYRFAMAALGLVALLRFDTQVKTGFIAAILLFGYIFGMFNDPGFSEFLSAVVPRRMRGRFFAVRDALLIFSGTVTSLLLGAVLDYFRSAGREYTGFAIIFIFIFAVQCVICYIILSMKEPTVRLRSASLRLRDVFLLPLGHQDFRKFILYGVLWNFSIYFALSYYSIYMVSGLKLNYTFIAVLSLISTASRMIFSRVWGKLGDLHSWRYVMIRSLLILSLMSLGWFLATPSNAYVLLPIVHIASGIGWGGIGLANFNSALLYSPKTVKTAYLSLNSFISSIMGFLATLAGAAFSKSLSGVQLRLPGFEIGNVQLIFLVTSLLLALVSLYVRLIMDPQK